MTFPVPVKLPSNNMADLAYPDIQAYLKECDMVLVPMASTEPPSRSAMSINSRNDATICRSGNSQ